MPLHIANRMFVVTSSGEREIQLCIGDLTTLPKEEKVDVVMVSAFPNNYSATSASVLGALKRELQLDVEELAYYHKKEDLRQNFNCWISKELPEHLPYRQLICFEKYRTTAERLDVAIKDVFRAMMPIFNNENKSVITPLLATGSQVAQKPKMLRGMLNAAIEWMKFGLPLQLLKIVVYNVPDEMKRELGAIFQEIKSRVELDRHPPKDPPKRHDVFLIYAKEDEGIASEMRNFLTVAKRRFLKYLGAANIITAADVATKKSSWQHDIIMAMLGSSSVVPILTMSFMSDPSCLDQYNLALCANRRTKRNLMAPFCLDSIPDMPIYMTLVQWFNCRPRDSVKIQNACILLMEQMKESFETHKVEYDIFVSYCHKNLDKAKVIVNSLKRENPAARIFFDQDELKTGQSWQQALYHSLDSVKCVIALISNDYLDSLVCNEELNVASAKHLSTAKSQELILITLEPTKKIPLFDYVKPVMADRSFEDLAGSVSHSVATWLKSGTKDSLFSPVEYPMDIQDLTETWRRHDLESNYFLSSNGIYLNDMDFDIIRRRSPKKDDLVYGSKPHEKTNADIFISYSLQDRRYASFLAWALARSPSNFSICSLSSSEANDTAQVDMARCVVVLLSLQYHRNPKKVEEFNYILSRARKHRVIYVIFVDVLPTRPWYMRVVHCNTALTDDFWPDALASLTNSSKDGMIFTPEVNSAKTKIEKMQGPLMSREILALLKATCDVENICLAARNGKKTSVHMQKGIFFNIVDLKKSLEVQTTRKREFTIVASDYGKHSKDADDSQNKDHPNSRTANSGRSQHLQLSAENSEINKSPDHGYDARAKASVPHNDNHTANASFRDDVEVAKSPSPQYYGNRSPSDIANASFRSKDDADVAKSPSSRYHDNHSPNDIANASFRSKDDADVAKSPFPSPRYHDNHSPNDIANASFRSRDDADVAKSPVPSPRYHDNHSPNGIANASFRSKDDADVAKSPSPQYRDNHSPKPNDPYSQVSVGPSPDHAGYNRQHQPVVQVGDREPYPAPAGGYRPQYSNQQYSRDDEYGHDPRAQNNNQAHSSDYQQNPRNTTGEGKKNKAKSSSTCTLL